MKYVCNKRLWFLVCLVLTSATIFSAEKAPVNTDSLIEKTCGVEKIHALKQRHLLSKVEGVVSNDRFTIPSIYHGDYFASLYEQMLIPIAHNCSYYAIFYAQLLFNLFKDSPEFDFDIDDVIKNPFQSEKEFQIFLETFELTEDFNDIGLLPVENQEVQEIAQKVNPKIAILNYYDNIKNKLNNTDGYQVFIYNKEGHWVAFGIDYRAHKIYFVDSMGYLNCKDQKYSSTDRKIISSIYESICRKFN